jgi:hypothetical protein
MAEGLHKLGYDRHQPLVLSLSKGVTKTPLRRYICTWQE